MAPPITERFEAKLTLAGAWLPSAPREGYFPGVDYPDQHQVEMYDILVENDEAVVINANPTGAGKTLSWAVPTIRSGEEGPGWIVVATYPTNALVENQLHELRSLMRAYYEAMPPSISDSIDLVAGSDGRRVLRTRSGEFPIADRVQRVTGEDTVGKSTTDELIRVVNGAEDAAMAGLPTIILTTPDLLTLVASNRLWNPDARGLVMGADAIVVDEFHLANPRAKRQLPFYLDFYQKRLGTRTQLSRLVFLSATPDRDHVTQIERGINAQSVSRQMESTEPANAARQVLPEATLYVTTGQMFQNAWWLSEHINELVAWLESGEEQAVIIVDSVREVETLSAELTEHTDLSVGKVYGWKRTGRNEVIRSSDIIVGNTAMEVGIDFKRVDRLLTTGYTPTNAIQRVGRMRAREELSDCEIALITTSAGYDSLLATAESGVLSRSAFDTAIRAIGDAGESDYYGLLCAMYFEYLWNDAEQALGGSVRRQDLDKYQETVYDHFHPDGQAFDADTRNPEAFWGDLQAVRLNEYGNTHPIFEEMRGYRSSSLSVAILDGEDPDEPLKEYSLHYILRYGNGQFISQNEASSVFRHITGRGMNSEELDRMKAIGKRGVGIFHLRGWTDASGDIGITDFRQLTVWRIKCKHGGGEVACFPDKLPNGEMKRLTGGIDGTEHIDFGDHILAQYIESTPHRARERFCLGPFASIYTVSESESFALWQDAILVHAQLMQKEYTQG